MSSWEDFKKYEVSSVRWVSLTKCQLNKVLGGLWEQDKNIPDMKGSKSRGLQAGVSVPNAMEAHWLAQS